MSMEDIYYTFNYEIEVTEDVVKKLDDALGSNKKEILEDLGYDSVDIECANEIIKTLKKVDNEEHWDGWAPNIVRDAVRYSKKEWGFLGFRKVDSDWSEEGAEHHEFFTFQDRSKIISKLKTEFINAAKRLENEGVELEYKIK